MMLDFYNHHAGAQKPVHAAGLVAAADIRERSALPWLPLRLPFWLPHEAMLAEARALRECFVPHRSLKEANSGWYSLCIHGLSSVHTGPHTRYGLDASYDWTDICRFCPETHAFFRDVFGYQQYFRVRFMLLAPGGFIVPHRDSAVDRLEAINIALNNPADCDFVMEDCGTVPFTDGTAMLLSLSRQHMVWNRSDEDRYHIIVHGTPDPTVWDRIVVASYIAANPTIAT